MEAGSITFWKENNYGHAFHNLVGVQFYFKYHFTKGTQSSFFFVINLKSDTRKVAFRKIKYQMVLLSYRKRTLARVY